MKFCCIFPRLKNFELNKEVGQIPYYLAKNHEYDSTIVTFDNDTFHNFHDLKEINLKIIPKRFKHDILNNLLIVSYLIKNAKNIDVLNCYHFKRQTILFFIVYKLFNRRGITYFTLDMEYEGSLKITGNYSKKYFYGTLKFLYLFKFLVDFATIESKKAYEVIINSHQVFREKLMYMPIFVEPNPYIDFPKKNQIISVGRIGAHQKASELVLEAFKIAIRKTNEKKWILKMVGPISDDFKKDVDKFLSENPKLKENIIFTGNIEDKNELYKIYSESKIFLLPSRHGSFEIVFVEALYYSNYLLITDVGTGKYLVDISNFGNIVEIDNIEDISNKLIDAIENYDNYVANNTIDFKKLVSKEFGSKEHIKNLDENFQKIKIRK